MAIKITTDTHTHELTVTGAIDGGGPVDHRYGNGQFRAELATVTWSRNGSGDWSVSHLQVSGPKILNDGSESPSRRGYWDYVGREKRPAWLARWVKETTPE